MKQTKMTWIRGTIAFSKVEIMTLKFSSWLRNLSGLRTLKSLKTFKNFHKIPKNINLEKCIILSRIIHNGYDNDEKIQNIPPFAHIRATAHDKPWVDDF